jgi:transcriptional regulator with XRE-family HTH domain
MSIHSEERRIAGLLRELMIQRKVPAAAVEGRLGWPSGRLEDLLEGRVRLGFDELLEVLPSLGVTPGEFFAGLYGFDAENPIGELVEESDNGTDGFRQRMLDRRFEESRRVVREAVARRFAWKQGRAEMPGSAEDPPPLPGSTLGPKRGSKPLRR